MNKTVIIYHKVDLDGKGSAAIAMQGLIKQGVRIW